MKKRTVSRILIISMIAVLSLFAVACDDEETTSANEVEQEEAAYEDDEEYETESDEEYTEKESLELSDETLISALSGEGAVTAFISEPFYDGKIEDEEKAAEVIYEIMGQLGGDDTTELANPAALETEEGITYYTFQQVVGDISVYGASVKLIVDKDQKAIGLVSALIPNLEAPSSSTWEIDDKEAEEIVKKEYAGDGLKIIPNTTGMTLLPIEDADSRYCYVWVVYTDNIYSDVDTAYLAHYVSDDGKFLYSMPVMNPGDMDSLSGSTATFAFSGMESDTWSGTVTDLEGFDKEVEIPVMKDPKTGDVYLGDADRMILCADYSDFENNDTLTPCIAENGKWDDELVITYDNFIKVYDTYAEYGWKGPDGDGTPSLLLMNAVDEEGNPLQNACYMGKKEGFQSFIFDSTRPYGECLDVVGHEFTHCFTETSMRDNLYKNDYGSINEGMSDIIGNLIAMMNDDEDKPFVIGDKFDDAGVMRDMANPNRFQQPAFVWDRYYVPDASEPDDTNDNGGVHTNSSLLNIISYELNKAGMEPNDQMYYWINVASVMTPRTDFAQMAQLLPWVMKVFGHEEYAKVIDESIAQTHIDNKEIPPEPAEGLGMVEFIFPNVDFETDKVTASFINIDEMDEYLTWPAAGTNKVAAALPAGDYFLTMNLMDVENEENYYIIYYDEGFSALDEQGYDELLENPEREMLFTLKAGETKTLDSDALDSLFE